MTLSPSQLSALRSIVAGSEPAHGTLSDGETIAAHENTAILDSMIREAAFVTLLPAVAAVVVRFTLPRGMLGILRGVALQAPQITDLDLITWQLRVNNNAVPGLDSVTGPQSSLQFPLPVLVPLYKNSVVTVVATSASAFPIIHVTAGLFGNYFPAMGGA